MKTLIKSAIIQTIDQQETVDIGEIYKKNRKTAMKLSITPEFKK